MQVSIENTSSLGRRVIIGIPAEKIQAEEADRLQEVSKTAKIDGFRKGKVPEKVLRQRFGPQIHQEMVAKLLDQSLREVLTQEKLNPAGRPVVENIEDKVGQDLQFVVSFEIYPPIHLKDLSEIQLEKPTAPITDADINLGIERLQEQFASWKVVERAAKKDDQVKIDFEGTRDGVPFEHGSAKDVHLQLGSGQFIPGFEDGLLGTEAGQEKILDLVFPKEYNVEELAGKEVQFKVLVHAVEEKEFAALDDQFAKRIGLKEGETDQIRGKVKENLEKFLDNVVSSQMREKALEAFLEAHPFEVPKGLVDQEIHSIHEDLKHRKGPEALDGEDPEALERQAEKRVRLGLLLSELIEAYKIKPDEARVRKRITELAGMFGNASFIENMYYQSKELLQGIRNSILADQAADLIVEKATLREIPKTFQEIVNRSS